MPNVVSNVMSNQFTNTETDSEGHNSIPLFHGRPLAQPNDSTYANTMGSPSVPGCNIRSHTHAHAHLPVYWRSKNGGAMDEMLPVR
ncbi:unnamed protein product [Penicillium glandicola]